MVTCNVHPSPGESSGPTYLRGDTCGHFFTVDLCDGCSLIVRPDQCTEAEAIAQRILAGVAGLREKLGAEALKKGAAA